jgi:hypothetical protein
MENNVGNTDALVRIVLGAVTGLASIGIFLDVVPLDAVFSPVLGVASVILLATAFTSKCAIYSALGINTSS